MRVFSFFILLSITLISGASDEKQIRFLHFITEDGLSNNTVNCIFQDSKGFIWFGTYGGINRYDGYQFKTFSLSKDSNSICSNKIVSLCEDRDGNLWIGSNDNGVSVYNPARGTFTNYSANIKGQPSLKHNTVTKIICDTKGNIWIATAGGGVSKYQNETKDYITYFPNDNNYSVPSRHVSGITEDNFGNIWLTHERNMLSKLDTTGKVTLFKAEYKGEPMFTSYFKELIVFNNILWIGTEDNGLFAFDILSEKFILPSDNPKLWSFGKSTVKQMQIDENNKMWIVNDGQGLSILDLDDYSYRKHLFDFCIEESLSTNALLSLLIDKNRNIWIGTNQGGINLYRHNSERFSIIKQNVNQGLKHPSVLCIVEDPDNNIWMGTDGGGLCKLSSETGEFIYYLHSDTPGSISGNNVIDLLIDSKNDLWAGTFGKGLNLLKNNSKSFKVYTPDENNPKSISHNNVWAIFEDSQYNIWVGTLGGGLNLFDRNSETFINYYPEQNDPAAIIHEQVSVIFEDSRKNLWIGTYGGLEIFHRDTKTFEHFLADNRTGSIPDNIINCIFEDSKNRLWICTDGGLSQFNYDSRKFKTVVFENGLINNSLQSVEEDSAGNLWISTRRGIMRYSPGKEKVLAFDQISGLPGSEFNGNSSLKGSDGRIFFGSTQGLCSFHPEEFTFDTSFPSVTLTTFKIHNQEIIPGAKYNNQIILPSSITYSESVELSYKDNVFTIEFSALEFSAPSKILYRYRLEGFDEKWIVTDASHRSATYTNLPGGDYTFLLSSTNSSGNWNPKPVTLSILIDPPFWKTLWFRILITLIILLIIYVIYRTEREQYRHKIKERALSNEKEMVRQRNEELRSEIASSTMLLAQKNEMLQKVVQNVEELRASEQYSSKLDETLKLLTGEIDRDNYWEQFQFNFDRVYMNLLGRLKETYPELTRSNLKLCAYLRLNLSSKEIASLLNITLSGVDKARNRLRKRIGLEPHEDLYDFLLNF
ncbi:MAG: hypothetical protein JW894_15945 [Bacteroidales bacterium]|nr:hypothetical protein [Bacteroidales bacterium]